MTFMKFLGYLFHIGAAFIAFVGISVSSTGEYDRASYLMTLSIINILVGNIYLKE